jgi:broad specificity phosphatase PhoE
MYGLYVTHPQVVMDPDVPTPRWQLDEVGLERARRFAAHALLAPVRRIVSSDEPKALQLATALAAGREVTVESSALFGETRRSGYLDREAFERALDGLYGGQPIAGWESAEAALTRMLSAVDAALAKHDLSQPIAFTGHGTVGTLLKCHYGRRALARGEDQRRMADPGGGNVFVFRLADRSLVTDWVAMENLPGHLSL